MISKEQEELHRIVPTMQKSMRLHVRKPVDIS